MARLLTPEQSTRYEDITAALRALEEAVAEAFVGHRPRACKLEVDLTKMVKKLRSQAGHLKRKSAALRAQLKEERHSKERAYYNRVSAGCLAKVALSTPTTSATATTPTAATHSPNQKTTQSPRSSTIHTALS